MHQIDSLCSKHVKRIITIKQMQVSTEIITLTIHHTTLRSYTEATKQKYGQFHKIISQRKHQT